MPIKMGRDAVENTEDMPMHKMPKHSYADQIKTQMKYMERIRTTDEIVKEGSDPSSKSRFNNTPPYED